LAQAPRQVAAAGTIVAAENCCYCYCNHLAWVGPEAEPHHYSKRIPGRAEASAPPAAMAAFTLVVTVVIPVASSAWAVIEAAVPSAIASMEGIGYLTSGSEPRLACERVR